VRFGSAPFLWMELTTRRHASLGRTAPKPRLHEVLQRQQGSARGAGTEVGSTFKAATASALDSFLAQRAVASNTGGILVSTPRNSVNQRMQNQPCNEKLLGHRTNFCDGEGWASYWYNYIDREKPSQSLSSKVGGEQPSDVKLLGRDHGDPGAWKSCWYNEHVTKEQSLFEAGNRRRCMSNPREVPRCSAAQQSQATSAYATGWSTGRGMSRLRGTGRDRFV